MSTSHNPLEQFTITPSVPLTLAGHDVSFTNASLWMVVVTVAVLLLMGAASARRALVPGRLQSFAEVLMNMVGNTLTDVAGKEAMRYFPAIFTLFMFILFANLAGMLPYSFTVTSHIAVTFALAALVFLGTTLIMIARHGIGGFLHYFLPHGTPWWMIWLIYPIEVISYLSRPVSLSIRLAANMTAGHILLKIMAGFVVMLGGALSIAPFVLVIGVTGFEIGIAILQAYIFTVLTCVYLHDAIHLH